MAKVELDEVGISVWGDGYSMKRVAQNVIPENKYFKTFNTYTFL